MISRAIDKLIGAGFVVGIWSFYQWIKVESFVIQRFCNHNIINQYGHYCVKCGKEFEVW